MNGPRPRGGRSGIPPAGALDAGALTWPALLGRWIDFARASLAVPAGAEGERWRAAVPAVINLQAVTFALADLARLPEAARPHARDVAEIVIRDNVTALNEAWGGAPWPEALREIAADARAAREASVYAGAVELVWEGRGDRAAVLLMPELPLGGEEGTLAVMQPGTLVMPGEPVAWWAERGDEAIARALPGAAVRSGGVPRQVYRQVDHQRRIVRDVVRSILADPAPGFPLLVPLVAEGRRIGAFTLEAATWEARQRTTMPPGVIPVVEE